MTDAPWLVALDVDGTILHEDETIAPVVRDAVRAVAEAGHRLTLATGRSWVGTRDVLEMLDLAPELVVCANGALLMEKDATQPDGYRRAHVDTFDPGPVLRLVREHLPDGRFLVEDADGFRLYTRGMDYWNLDDGREVEFDELLGHLAMRVVVVSPDHDEEEFFRIVESMGLHRVSYSVGWTAWLDLAPDGVNKATGMERIRDRWDIPRDRLLVVGDGRNDIDMFEWAAAEGHAVAMGQAPDEVKAAATEVTGSIDDDGLVQALSRLLPG